MDLGWGPDAAMGIRSCPMVKPRGRPSGCRLTRASRSRRCCTPGPPAKDGVGMEYLTTECAWSMDPRKYQLS